MSETNPVQVFVNDVARGLTVLKDVSEKVSIDLWLKSGEQEYILTMRKPTQKDVDHKVASFQINDPDMEVFKNYKGTPP